MIYFIQDSEQLHIKIGYAKRSVKNRLKTLQPGNPSKLVLLLEMEGDRRFESELHRKFALWEVRREWFRPTPDLLRFIISRRSMMTEDFFAQIIVRTASSIAALAFRIHADYSAEDAEQRLAGLCGSIDTYAADAESGDEGYPDTASWIVTAVESAWKDEESSQQKCGSEGM